MKKILLVLILMFCLNGMSQCGNENDQKRYYENALYSLNNGNSEYSFRLFKMAFKINQNNDIGKESLKRYDSLKVTLRKHLITIIKGDWVQIKNSDNLEKQKTEPDTIKNMITITDNEIVFYETNINQTITKNARIEKLTSNKLALNYLTFNNVLYSDNQIWNYSFDYENNYLKIKHFGELIGKEKIIEYINLGKTELTYKRIN